LLPINEQRRGTSDHHTFAGGLFWSVIAYGSNPSSSYTHSTNYSI